MHACIGVQIHMNYKDTVFDGGSNYFWEIELDVIESSYGRFNLILPEKLVFTRYYLKPLINKDHFILLSLVPQAFYRALRVCRKKALIADLCRNQNDIRFRARRCFFLWSYLVCMGLWREEQACYLHPYPLNTL